MEPYQMGYAGLMLVCMFVSLLCVRLPSMA